MYLLTTTCPSKTAVYNAPKKPKPTPAWVARTAAPAKLIVPKVTVLNKLTSSEWKGFVATVDERIEWCQFQTLVTKNFSSWEDVRKHLGVDPEVIVRLHLLARAPASSCTRCAPSAQPSRTQFVATNAREVFVGAEAQVAESTICVVSCVPHRHACVVERV